MLGAQWFRFTKFLMRTVFLRDQTLTVKLFVFSGLLVVIPMLIVGYISYYRSSAVIQEEAEHYSKQIIEQVKAHVEQYVRDFEISTLKMMNHPDMIAFMRMRTPEEIEQSGIRASVERVVNNAAYSRSDISAITVILDNIQVIDTVGSKNVMPITDLRNEYWYDSVPQNGDPILISRVIRMQERQEPVISIVKHIVSPYTLEPIGMMIIDVNYKRLQDIADKVSIGRTGAMYILDKQGHYVYHPDLRELGKQARYAGLPMMLRAESGSFISDDGEHFRDFLTFSHSSFLGWTLLTSVPYQELTQGINYIGKTILWTTLMTLCIAYLLGVGFASSIIRPIRNLQQFMKRIEVGDFTHKVAVESKDEIGLLSHGFNKMVDRLKGLLEEIYFSKLKETEMSLRHREMELKALQSQINPHFLYNSLETIRGMALEQDMDEIADMASSLARLLRYNLKETELLVPMEHELAVCELYLRIQKYRFEEKLEYVFDVPEWAFRQNIVRFSLQPIIENCVIHGIEPSAGTTRIRVTASQDSDDSYTISISDTGPGIEPGRLREIRTVLNQRETAATDSTHIGMMNVHRRIEMLCGEGYGLVVDSRYGQGTSVLIRLPFSKRKLARTS